MYEEEIKELDKWFNDKERSYDTGFDGEYYVVGERDVEDFCDFLRDLNPDLIGFPCTVGTSGIWFERADLDKARYL